MFTGHRVVSAVVNPVSVGMTIYIEPTAKFVWVYWSMTQPAPFVRNESMYRRYYTVLDHLFHKITSP
jgi:hypothetical protein